MNYGDYSYVENFVQDGASTFALPNVPRRRQALTIWVSTGRRRARALRDPAGDPRASPPRPRWISPEAFEETRAFLLNYSKLWIQTPSRRLGFAMDGAFYGGKSLVDELADRLPRMTVDDVNGAVRRHLQPESLSVAVIADPAGRKRSSTRSATERALADRLRQRRRSRMSSRRTARSRSEPLPVERHRCRIVPAAEMFER